MGNYAVAIIAGIALPIFISRYVANVHWLAAIFALLGWSALLYHFMAGSWEFRREELMWTLGFAVFSNWLAVPLLAVGLHYGFRLVRNP